MGKAKNSIVFGLLLALSLAAQPALAQIGMLGYGQQLHQGQLAGGIGYTSVDNQSYFTVTLTPELSFGKIGLGLNINLLYNSSSGRIRSQDWDENYDYLRAVRYVRYGWKGDPFYARAGTLDAARIGHGFIMNYYTNEAHWDSRKVGLALDFDQGRVGFESMTSNLARGEIFGGRLYFRPLADLASPLWRNLIVGASFVTDVDPDGARLTSNDQVSVFGLDIEQPIIDLPMIWTALYADLAKIENYGSGRAIGIGARLNNLGGLARIEARLERRWMGKQFMPNYFDAFYEIDRFTLDADQAPAYKTDVLAGIGETTRGVFGEMYASLVGLVDVLGSFQRLDGKPNSGMLHFAASTTARVPTIALEASYDKRNIGSFSDVGGLDSRSIARVGIGYRVKPYLFLFMDYIWTFALDETGQRYVPQERYAPRLVFSYDFPL